MSTALFHDDNEIHRSAVISQDGKYRYRLDRWWGPESTATGSLRMPFLMLNPSTADAQTDDPTIRRCMGFARREGFNGITVVNLGAFRATDPDVWCKAIDPFGPENTQHVTDVAETANFIVAAWGAHPAAAAAAAPYLELFDTLGIPVLCLGHTKPGAPRHPLYVRGDQPLISFSAARRAVGGGS